MAEENVQENSQIEEDEPNFPEGSELVIERILKKYGLEKNHQEGLENFFKTSAPEERERIMINLPGVKISGLLRRRAKGEVKPEKLPDLLQEDLNIPQKEAEDMARELEKEIISSMKLIKENGQTKEEKKPILPEKPDTYRESIE